jgi:hypothetical protein
VTEEYRQELKEVKAESIRRLLNRPTYHEESYWYKINPYTKRKLFIVPPAEPIPDKLKEPILKALLVAEEKLLETRKRKLKIIKELDLNIRWFFEELEAAEFAEYYVIQKWVGKLLYG